MNDEIPTYRAALKDSSHPFYEATWLIFSENMKLDFANKRLADQKDDLIPYFLEIIDDESLAEDGSLGKGMAPVHAVELLGEWRVKESTPRLLDILENGDDLTYIWDAAIRALGQMGPGIVDDLFAYLERAEPDAYDTIAGILSDTGKGNQRVFDWLAAQLDQQKDHWDIRWYAECLLACDKEQAIILLEERLKKGKYDKQLRLILKSWIEVARRE